MKNPVFSTLLLAAVLVMGLMAYRVSESKKALEGELERTNEKLKITEAAYERSKVSVEKSQQTSLETLKKLETSRADFRETKQKLTVVTRERDILKDQLAAEKRKTARVARTEKRPQPVTSAKPDKSEEEEAEPGFKPGTVDLPAGFSRPNGEIKRPGE